jgi:hypothetical protein
MVKGGGKWADNVEMNIIISPTIIIELTKY